MNKRAITLAIWIFLLLHPVCFAEWTDVNTSGWVSTASSLGLKNDIRGVSYNSATGNLVVGATDNRLAIVNSRTGMLIKNIINAGTGGTWLALYRVGVSTDGYIYTHGITGIVKLIGTEEVDDAQNPIAIFNAEGSVISRAMAVKGAHLNGTARVFILKGAMIHVFANSPISPEVYTQVVSFPNGYNDYQGYSAGGLAVSDDLSMIVTQSPSGMVGSKKLNINMQGNILAGYSVDEDFETPAGCHYFNDVAFDEFRRLWVYSVGNNCNGVHYTTTRFVDMDNNMPIGAGLPIPGGLLNGPGNYNVFGSAQSTMMSATAFDKIHNDVYVGSTDIVVKWSGILRQNIYVKLSTPEGCSKANVTIPYDLYDSQSRPINIYAQYSLLHFSEKTAH